MGAHLLAAGMLIDSDPQLAYAHAEAARRRAARLPVVREAAAEAAYAAGEFSAALTEYRALRRMTGSVEYLAVIADCERALGRPEAALRLLREQPLADVDDDVRIEMLLVEAGAREDLGQTDEAWRLLKQAVDNAPGSAVARARVQHGFAELLLRRGDEAGARRWLASAARLDEEGVVGSADRIAELDGMVIEVDEEEFLDADPGSSDVAQQSASADASTRGE